MLDLSIVHRPGILNGREDLGRILEAMLYYDRVHLMMDANLFLGLWDMLGPDDLGALLGHPTITTTLTPEMLAIHNNGGSVASAYRPIAMKLSGRVGKLIPDSDDVGSLLYALRRLPNRSEGSRSQVAKLLKMTKRSRYSKMLGGHKEHRKRIVSLIRDPATLKLFVRGWAIAHGRSLNEPALRNAQIDVIELDEEFIVTSTVPLNQLVAGWTEASNWGLILNNVQDFAVDLYLSDANSADIVTAPDIAEIASARLDLSLQRAQRNQDQISAFEEMVFDQAHAFGDAFNRGVISFKEALKIIDQSRRFRTWTKGLAPDANLIQEYHRAVTKDTSLKNLPASVARFSIFNGAGIVAGTLMPGAGLITSAIDSFVVERLIGGWRPNIFVRNVRKALDAAERRAE